MSKVKVPRHVQDVVDYAKSLGLDPELRHGAHYVMSWNHAGRYGRIIIGSTPRDVDSTADTAKQKIRRQIRSHFA